jgi:hypothetical protein
LWSTTITPHDRQGCGWLPFAGIRAPSGTLERTRDLPACLASQPEAKQHLDHRLALTVYLQPLDDLAVLTDFDG